MAGTLNRVTNSVIADIENELRSVNSIIRGDSTAINVSACAACCIYPVVGIIEFTVTQENGTL